MMKSTRRGFTLIELLVVIAIIGILSSVVLASLNTARKKGRDARRLADIKQLQLALELSYDANGFYPATTSIATLVTPGYIASLPTDPANQHGYAYEPYAATAATSATCSGYHLGASLEVSNNTALNSDADANGAVSPVVVCTAAGVVSATDFNGTDANNQCTTGDAGVSCYDVKS